ncbi:MAG: NADH-quinone oxidoreductase subunit J [Flammeovirgaceae bacterium]|nr:NADH-quinone oxidoreductase subunit J [Flammeovirgaceae bacterium]
MNLLFIIFYAFCVLAVFSALGILLTKNLLHAALFLLVCLVSLSGVYIFSMAEWLAVTQLLIYAAGIVVLIVFGIMLTNSTSGKPLQVSNARWMVGLLLGAGFCFLLVKTSNEINIVTPHANPTNALMQQTGKNLMSDFALPFEVAGLLLLLALVGAAVISSSPIKKEN